jgi:ferritin
MLKEKVQDALNEQINAELYSAYLYLSMSAYFESANLSGFANWMRVQYQEEFEHAMRFYNYICDRGGRVFLKQIDAPKTEWASNVEVFENTLNHERHVSELIHKLVDLAREERDHATENMLAWFVEEQVEEEATAEKLLDEIRMIGDARSGLFMMDRELGQRSYTPPPGDEAE